MMAWTPEHRRRYAPAIEHVVRSNAITRGTNSAAEDLRRLHTLVVEAQPSFPFAGIKSAVDVVLQIEGRGDRRRLADIWRVPHGSETGLAS